MCLGAKPRFRQPQCSELSHQGLVSREQEKGSAGRGPAQRSARGPGRFSAGCVPRRSPPLRDFRANGVRGCISVAPFPRRWPPCVRLQSKEEDRGRCPWSQGLATQHAATKADRKLLAQGEKGMGECIDAGLGERDAGGGSGKRCVNDGELSLRVDSLVYQAAWRVCACTRSDGMG